MAGSIGARPRAPLIWPLTSRRPSTGDIVLFFINCLQIPRYVDFAMNRVRMLVHFGIIPYLVFDGDYLPSKAGTEKERAERRRESKRLGLELLRVGKTSQAHLELQKAVDVTPEMARMLIEELKRHNIQYIVAPYEADSQLAYLERKGVINGILSEDSDLLVFGAKCLITKLDKYGECVEINRNHFTACREISLVGWTDADFRRMAMLSGCDYLPGIGNMGLKTAYRMLRKHKTTERLLKAAQFDGKFKVPPGYIDAFYQAEKTFLYQWVFCPLLNQLVNLTALDADEDIAEIPFIGEEVPSHVAIGVARGDLHPHTKKPIMVEAKAQSNFKPLRPSRTVSSNVQTPDLKQSKPIDSFFKPKRMPLAELDPNSFTPSPSQQSLLQQQQNSAGWEAVPAPQSLSQQRSAHARTAPQPARRAISDSITARQSAPNPSKRQRLCSDSAFDTPEMGNNGITRSRFFADSVPDPSPSLRTNRKHRKKSVQDFELYSDDSIGEALAEIVDLEEVVSQPKKKLKIFKDDFRCSMTSDSQSTAASRSSTEQSAQSQDSGILTPASSHVSPEPETLFSAALSKQVHQDLRSRFSYSSKAMSSSAVSDTANLNPNRPPALSKRVSSVGRPASVANESRQALPEAAPSNESLPETHDDLIEDSAWAALEAEVVVAASSPPPEPTIMKPREAKGSEDLLVPDSDAESTCSPRKPLLSLGRFAFFG